MTVLERQVQSHHNWGAFDSNRAVCDDESRGRAYLSLYLGKALLKTVVHTQLDTCCDCVKVSLLCMACVILVSRDIELERISCKVSVHLRPLTTWVVTPLVLSSTIHHCPNSTAAGMYSPIN